MKAPHTIDLTRLDRLRDQLENAKGARDKAQEAALDAHRKLGVIQADARSMEERAAQNFLNRDSRELKADLIKFKEEVRLQTIVKDELFAKVVPLSERAMALGQLVQRCADFAGALNHAR